MSVKIKVSYQNPEELEKVLEVLKPIIKSYGISRNKKGRFKKAYIELK